VALAASRVAERDIDRLVLNGRARAGVHRVRAEVAAPLGDAAVRARVALADPPVYRVGALDARASRDARPLDVGLGDGRVRVKGRGTDEAQRRARADVVVTSAAIHGVPLEAAEAHVRLAGRAVTVRAVDVTARPVGVRLDGAGHVDLGRREATLRLAAGADLRAIGAWLGQPLAGRLTASATASVRSTRSPWTPPPTWSPSPCARRARSAPGSRRPPRHRRRVAGRDGRARRARSASAPARRTPRRPTPTGGGGDRTTP
jgi:hypothetical protein